MWETFIDTSKCSRLALDAVFLLLSIIIVNAFPAVSMGPSGELGSFIAELALGSLGASLYAYLKAGYIVSHTLCRGERKNSGLLANIQLLAYSLTLVWWYFAALLVLAVASVLLGLAAISNPGNWWYFATIGSILALGVDAVVLPYLIVTRTAGSGNGIKVLVKGFVLLFLAWQVIAIPISIAVNYALSSLLGPAAVLPYYRISSSELKALLERGAVNTWAPSYGELVAVLVVARYTRWAVRKFFA